MLSSRVISQQMSNLWKTFFGKAHEPTLLKTNIIVKTLGMKIGQYSHTQDSDAKLFNYMSLSQENLVTSALRSNFTHLFSLYKHTNVSILKFLGV